MFRFTRREGSSYDLPSMSALKKGLEGAPVVIGVDDDRSVELRGELWPKIGDEGKIKEEAPVRRRKRRKRNPLMAGSS